MCCWHTLHVTRSLWNSLWSSLCFCPFRRAIKMTKRWRLLLTTQPSWTSSSVRSVWLSAHECVELHEAVHEWIFLRVPPFFCLVHTFEIRGVLCVCFRSRTSGTALIKLMRMWLKSKSCTRSSCLLLHQIRVRAFTTTSFSSCSPDLTHSGSYWECFSYLILLFILYKLFSIPIWVKSDFH